MLPMIPVEEITDRARQARPGLAILTALLFLPWLLGWLARQAWMALVFLTTAVMTGWRDAGHDGEREQSPQQQQQPGGWS